MHQHSKLPARFLLVLLGTILIAAGMASVSLATDFEILAGKARIPRHTSKSTTIATTSTKTVRS